MSKHRLAVVILFLVTIAIGAGAIYIGYTLQQQEQINPDDASANTNTLTCQVGLSPELMESTSAWDVTVSANDNITISQSQLTIDSPSHAEDPTLLSTYQLISGDFSIELSLDELDVSGQNSGKFSFNLLNTSDLTAYSIEVQKNPESGGLAISSRIPGSAGIEAFIIPLSELSGRNLVDLKLIRVIDHAITKAYIWYRLSGESYELLGAVEGTSIYSGDVKLALGVESLAPQNPDTTAKVSSINMTCPVDSDFAEATLSNVCSCAGGAIIGDSCNISTEPVCRDDTTCLCQESSLAEITPTPTIIEAGLAATTIPVSTSVPLAATPTQAPSTSIDLAIVASDNLTCQDSSASVSYDLIVTNNSSRTSLAKVELVLDTKVTSTMVQSQSITFGGVLTGQTITWDSLVVLEAGESITLELVLVIPAASYGTYVHTYNLYEQGKDDTILDTGTVTTNATCLPATALINNTFDRVLLGVVLLIIGMALYKAGLYKEIGTWSWNLLGHKVLPQVSKHYEDELKDEFEVGVESSYGDN